VTEWLSDAVVAVQIVPCGADNGCGVQGLSTVGRCGVVGVVKMALLLVVGDFGGRDKVKSGVRCG